MNFLREENFPFVMVGKPYDHISEITHVDNDNFRAGEEITADLIRNGHQKIAFIGGSKDLFVTRDREAGYKRSEEHTSELQSRGHLVCCLLLEKNNDHEVMGNKQQYPSAICCK